MSHTYRARVTLAILMAAAAGVFSAGVRWGLPTRAYDAFLFGERAAWSGKVILELAPAWIDPNRGADVDANPITSRDEVTPLNETDAQRAEIIRRYRLFSEQPDEMITFKSLAGIRPGQLQFDPKLYQYGALWIYPVGALLRLTLDLNPDITHYLDNPDAFGRFYVVARLYSAAWGVLGVWAVFWTARRLSGGNLISAIAATCAYIVMPVVVNMSHEAKPHLAGTALVLLSIVAATRFVETGRARWWICCGALCGAAAGMVLSASIAFIIPPVMVMLTRKRWSLRFAIAAGAVIVGILVYFATNPYVLIHLLRDRQHLRSNLSNSAAMYTVGQWWHGALNATRLIREGCSVPLLLFGTVALIVLSIRALMRHRPPGPTAWLLLAPSAAVLIPFTALAAGKPGEYARFALLADITLAIVAGTSIGLLFRRKVDRAVVTVVLILFTAAPSWFYLIGFVRDSTAARSRFEDAAWIERLRMSGAKTMALFAEPAPYSLPPANLFEWKLLLVPRQWTVADAARVADVVLRPVDELPPRGSTIDGHVLASLAGASDRFPTRISWAGKPFEIWVRRDILERALRTPS